ncbi:MAG TPA: hypothetical protein VG013_06705, partial [Gemmataceae bacterium]|nr:hypothetical protein [Gemmataceae bacterium]
MPVRAFDDAFFLPDHARDLLEQALGVNAGLHGRVLLDLFGPELVLAVVAESFGLHGIADRLRRLVIEPDLELPVAAAFEKVDACRVIAGNAERVRKGPLLLLGPSDLDWVLGYGGLWCLFNGILRWGINHVLHFTLRHKLLLDLRCRDQ